MGLIHVATIPNFLPVSVTKDFVLGIVSKGIAQWSPGQREPELVASLERTLFERTIGRHQLARRIFRLGMACGHHLEGGRFLVANRRAIRLVDLDGTVRLEKSLDDGMRPLRLTRVKGVSGFDDGVYYGDYGSNPSRRPLTIHRRDAEGVWHRSFTFPAGTSEHIHSIVPDPRRGCLWVFTGDYGSAAAIWHVRSGFSHVDPVIRGTQLGRACVGFPVDEGLLYATDSHLEPNSIRLLQHEDGRWRSEQLRPMVGSCIYGGRLGGSYAFTTAFEPGEPTGHRMRDLIDVRPGPGILGRACELVVGTPAAGFRTELRWKVDWLPKRLFQFSTLILPDLDSDASLFAVYAMGIRGRNGATEIYVLDA
jgi:hypothetical protein